ncbi:ribbon-helix-helix protein, CopG family [Demequina pelophila]|uniref:ribbon-helix-helix protein, CopG family n=1 Tax=Demequina pelophila TaxID=1638984 RepID=UPI0007816E95|nr:ribbon-helix-helix protein, CopG family [Demequina pelophila]
MKTAISVPDPIFDQVTRRAAELGVSRSEFFATAARRYLRELDDAGVTARIDSVLERVAIAQDESTRFVADAGRALFDREDW